MVSRLSNNHYGGQPPKYIDLFSGLGSTWLESWIRVPILFTLIVLYQGMFSGNALVIPKRLQRAFDSPVFQFFSLIAIALSAVPDLEIAIFSTCLFLAIIWLLKTPEERRRRSEESSP